MATNGNLNIAANQANTEMSDCRQIHVGTVGEAPIRFYERHVSFAECPWVALVDIFRALALPQDRDEAVIASMSRDYVGGVLATADGTILIAPPLAGELVRAARVFGKQFSPEAWCLQFVAASDDALQKILVRLPPDVRGIYAENARSNTWGKAVPR